MSVRSGRLARATTSRCGSWSLRRSRLGWAGPARSGCCRGVPAVRLEREQQLLTPLPSLRPSIGPAPACRKVDKLSTIRYGSARYSVPTRLRGASVAVLVQGPRVTILDTSSGEVHAEHPLMAPGEASILDEHYGGPRPAVPARAIRPQTVAEKQFCALGPVAEAFIAGAAAAGHTRLGPELAELNTLTAAHGTQAMLAALERAVAFSRWKAADVRSILAAGAGIPTPRPAGDALPSQGLMLLCVVKRL